MAAVPTDTAAGPKAPRGRKLWALGVAAAVVLAVLGAGGAYWWQERGKPSQASAADCALAQDILDRTRQLPREKDAVTKWQKNTRELRSEKMKDGYLGLQISKYESWAAEHAKGESQGPGKAELKKTADAANSHCTEAERTLTFPTVGSR